MTRPLARLMISDHPSRPLTLVSATPANIGLQVLRVAGVEDVAEWHDLAAGFVLPEDLADAVEQAADASDVPVRRRSRRA